MPFERVASESSDANLGVEGILGGVDIDFAREQIGFMSSHFPLYACNFPPPQTTAIDLLMSAIFGRLLLENTHVVDVMIISYNRHYTIYHSGKQTLLSRMNTNGQ